VVAEVEFEPDRMETALVATAEQMDRIARRAEMMARASRTAAKSATAMAAAGRRARSARAQSPDWLPWAILGAGVLLLLALLLGRRRKKRKRAREEVTWDAPSGLEPEPAAGAPGAAAG
jgi:LPXTG-motif cell wall-anchored protein